MLEHVPAWLGKALTNARAGMDALAIARPELGGRFAALTLSSPAFADGARLPERFTADGDGHSPPLVWAAPPDGTASLALLVEDADAPAPQPLVHAIVWDLPPGAGTLAEGAIAARQDDVGRNSYLRTGWLPPDPPTGHGEHRYAFQLFALDAGAGDPGAKPGRGAIIEAMTGHVLAAGLLIGTYSREDEASVGPVGAAAPPLASGERGAWLRGDDRDRCGERRETDRQGVDLPTAQAGQERLKHSGTSFQPADQAIGRTGTATPMATAEKKRAPTNETAMRWAEAEMDMVVILDFGGETIPLPMPRALQVPCQTRKLL